MSEATQLSKLTGAIHVKVLATLSFIIAMDCTNIIVAGEGIWQWVFHISSLAVTVRE